MVLACLLIRTIIIHSFHSMPPAVCNAIALHANLASWGEGGGGGTDEGGRVVWSLGLYALVFVFRFFAKESDWAMENTTYRISVFKRKRETDSLNIMIPLSRRRVLRFVWILQVFQAQVVTPPPRTPEGRIIASRNMNILRAVLQDRERAKAAERR